MSIVFQFDCVYFKKQIFFAAIVSLLGLTNSLVDLSPLVALTVVPLKHFETCHCIYRICCKL